MFSNSSLDFTAISSRAPGKKVINERSEVKASLGMYQGPLTEAYCSVKKLPAWKHLGSVMKGWLDERTLSVKEYLCFKINRIKLDPYIWGRGLFCNSKNIGGKMNNQKETLQMKKKTKMNYISLTSLFGVLSLLFVYGIFLFSIYSINMKKIIQITGFLLITLPIFIFLLYMLINYFKNYGKITLTRNDLQIKSLFKHDKILSWKSTKEVSFSLSKGMFFPWIRIRIISNELSISINQYSYKKNDFNDIMWFILHISELYKIDTKNFIPARLDDIYQRYPLENFEKYL